MSCCNEAPEADNRRGFLLGRGKGSVLIETERPKKPFEYGEVATLSGFVVGISPPASENCGVEGEWLADESEGVKGLYD